MGLKYRKNSTSYETLGYTSRVTTPSLCYRKNGTTYYVPLLLNGVDTTVGSYVYKAAGPALCCRYNGNTYKAATSREAFTPDIAAGTYTPSTFRGLISQFISNNGSRNVANAYSVKVNGTTKSYAAGTYIRNMTTTSTSGTGSSGIQTIQFNQSRTLIPADAVTFNGVYVVNVASINPSAPYVNWAAYNSYSITVNAPGIKFE